MATENCVWLLFRKMEFSRKYSLKQLCLLTLFIVCSTIPGQCLEIKSNDNNNLLVRIDEIKQEAPVALQWGVSDTTAVLGHLFQYHIPSDAFKGQILKMKVIEVGPDYLPAWLHFDGEKRLLSGVPGPKDLRQHGMEVVVTGTDGSEAKDRFTITVTRDSSLKFIPLNGNSPQNVKCKAHEPQTAVTIVVDSDLDQLSPLSKVSLIRNFESHLKLASEMLKLLPVGDKPVFDNSALVAGPGDAKEAKLGGAYVTWLVGCGKVEPDHMSVLQTVETHCGDGKMAKAIGHPVLGWQVTNSRFQKDKSRKRRQAIQATPVATPGITKTAPTKLPVDVKTAIDVETMTRHVPSMESSSVKIVPTQPVKPAMKTDDPQVVTSPTSDTHATLIAPSPTVTMDKTTHMKTDELPTKPVILPTEEVKPTKKVVRPGRVTSKPTEVPTPEPETTPKVIHPVDPCTVVLSPPRVIHEIPKYVFTVGKYYREKIPENTFDDCSDGRTRNLKLNLFKNSKDRISKSFWLEFVNKKQQMIAMPMKEDVGKYMFTVVAENNYGLTKSHSFEIDVRGTTDEQDISHEISFTIDEDYDDFMSSFKNRLHVSNKIAKYYGDKHPKHMTITRIDQGSVIYAWSNNSLPQGCPVDQITDLVDKSINEDSTLNDNLKNALRPYVIKDAAVAPEGECLNNPNFPTRSTKMSTKTSSEPEPAPVPSGKPVIPVVTDKTMPSTHKPEVDKSRDSSDDEIWITTVVPVLVIVAVLFLALIIACILYRKKRKGKMSLEDQHTFSNKGVPVIFADELDEKPTDSTKPLIMDDEKPPLPPPEYKRGSSESAPSTPPTEPKEEYELEDTDVTSPLYQPPPPVTTSGNNKPPRHVQPAYRNPPPYVPP